MCGSCKGTCCECCCLDFTPPTELLDTGLSSGMPASYWQECGMNAMLHPCCGSSSRFGCAITALASFLSDITGQSLAVDVSTVSQSASASLCLVVLNACACAVADWYLSDCQLSCYDTATSSVHLGWDSQHTGFWALCWTVGFVIVASGYLYSVDG